jgi:hypothetical protein
MISEQESRKLYPHLAARSGPDKKHLGGGALFQNPYRKNVVAVGPEDIRGIGHSACVSDPRRTRDGMSNPS